MEDAVVSLTGAQIWSPMAEISISSPHDEHLIAGKKLAGRAPSADNAAKSAIVGCIARRPELYKSQELRSMKVM